VCGLELKKLVAGQIEILAFLFKLLNDDLVAPPRLRHLDHVINGHSLRLRIRKRRKLYNVRMRIGRRGKVNSLRLSAGGRERGDEDHTTEPGESLNTDTHHIRPFRGSPQYSNGALGERGSKAAAVHLFPRFVNYIITLNGKRVGIFPLP